MQGGRLRQCCCEEIDPDQCPSYSVSIICNEDEYLPIYRPQALPGSLCNQRADSWQPYCLRGLIYRHRSSDGERYININRNLGGYDECLALSSVMRDRQYLDLYNFSPCVDLNPVIGPASIDWRCVDAADFLDNLAEIAYGAFRSRPHDVIVRVEYFRHIYGDCILDENGCCQPFEERGETAIFRNSGIHYFEISAYAVLIE